MAPRSRWMSWKGPKPEPPSVPPLQSRLGVDVTIDDVPRTGQLQRGRAGAVASTLMSILRHGPACPARSIVRASTVPSVADDAQSICACVELPLPGAVEIRKP